MYFLKILRLTPINSLTNQGPLICAFYSFSFFKIFYILYFSIFNIIYLFFYQFRRSFQLLRDTGQQRRYSGLLFRKNVSSIKFFLRLILKTRNRANRAANAYQSEMDKFVNTFVIHHKNGVIMFLYRSTRISPTFCPLIQLRFY